MSISCRDVNLPHGWSIAHRSGTPYYAVVSRNPEGEIEFLSSNIFRWWLNGKGSLVLFTYSTRRGVGEFIKVREEQAKSLFMPALMWSVGNPPLPKEVERMLTPLTSNNPWLVDSVAANK